MRNPLTMGPGHYSILLLHIRHTPKVLVSDISFELLNIDSLQTEEYGHNQATIHLQGTPSFPDSEASSQRQHMSC